MRVGVVGLKMGLYLAKWCRQVGMDVAAVCDRAPDRLAAAKEQLPEADVTERWQDLLTLGLDGVVLANDFDAHAPLALAFLARGVHVLSEAAACTSYEEGRRLIAAAESSSATYSFAENYVLHPHVRLVRAAVETGEVGRVGLVEADYLHGMSPETVAALIGDSTHWRGRIAATAYCTHTVSPVLAVTDAWPREVSAFSVDEADPRAAVVMTVRLSTGALAVTRHGFLQGEPDSHWSWLSVRGSRALAESVRGPGEQAWSVRFRAEAWASPGGVTRDEVRVPPPLTLNGTTVERTAEGTVLLLQAFQATMERGEPPLVGVRAAVAASLVGVAGAQSLRNGSRPVPVPELA
ncbi:oxidoreductase [Marinitenerispora sediminis]|uniref:Oxidoreductase n=1 Tax=Marinitenerispora sediminis TaxID=1931232 RepID=A0A368T5Y5_9ACTN|nr:oxidoreductase [Marinitenerispora sediminis]RCV58820.1 oxidoreductase [Marinitenerispora sediminis]RCV61307.1 oxidoreductase [Marinitenerispora sediminis]